MDTNVSPAVGLLQRAIANGWVKDPTRTTFQTPLTPQMQQLFQKDVQTGFGGKITDFTPDLSPTSDYDYQGWWKAMKAGDPRTVQQFNPYDTHLHFPDFWKTPYHHSFSHESQYATPNAPTWTQSEPYQLRSQQNGPVYSKGDTVFDEGPYIRNSQPADMMAALKLGWPESATGTTMPAPIGQNVLTPPLAATQGASAYFPVPAALTLATILHALSRIR